MNGIPGFLIRRNKVEYGVGSARILCLIIFENIMKIVK